MEEMMQILQEIRPDVDFAHEKKLIDDKIGEILETATQKFNETFDIEIDVEDLEPYNFNTVEAMYELITKLMNE